MTETDVKLCPDCGEPRDFCQCQWDEDDYDPDSNFCHQCRGDGWVTVGLDIDCDDGMNGPFDGETIKCPCCGGSGKASDCTYW